MDIHVLKFGGTSMNDHQSWKQVLEIIKQYEYPVVVVSATARTTRQLIEAAKLAEQVRLDEALRISESIKERHITLVREFLKESPHPKNPLIEESCIRHIEQKTRLLNKFLKYTTKVGELKPNMKDGIAAIGEQISSYLLAQCGLAVDILTQHVDAKKIIKTDTNYGSAHPNAMLINQKSGSLETILESGFTPIIGGFYGESTEGTITTLGFEGSDYSASLIGSALHAKAIEIWTDVSGVFTSDPRYIEDAKPIPKLSYYDATEMAYFGAKVLHPSTLKPAQERNIPVLVKNMFQPDDEGSLIVREAEHDRKTLAISFKSNIALLTISAYETVMGYHFLTHVFSVLEKHQLTVDAVNTTEASVTIALSDNHKLEELGNEFIEIGSVELEKQKGLISVIGCRVSKASELISGVFEVMEETDLDMISFTKEKRILNIALDEQLLTEAAQEIHTRLFS